ncbi:MAG TPA: pitrilysin family protein, partial [Woeseiaceae bacterium]|nr:pitrilysin family protein [Woeseiaceae bacterium]
MPLINTYFARVTRVACALRRCLAAMLAVAALVEPAAAQPIDLRNASVERLDNGLTVILLEDRRFPVASVQVLYRVGARDEVTGRTGLAHFLEHMAFRDSQNFAGTDVVSRIYAVGGEWHGYTWIDQTTYFSTVPADELDLVLRIEADRMGRLELAADDMEAERGAVLAEMHMYENIPGSMLIDAVNFTAFQAHPYRNNTIGWESDIEKLEYADVVDFYEQHYHPANAVIAVVGAFEPPAVRRRIEELFGDFERRGPTPLPRTEEAPQNGLRRITVHGDAGPPQFRIAYRAPSASSPDFAPFLVLQAVLGQSPGVNFLQNDWGTPVEPGAPLADAALDVTTWYPPSAQDYVFIVGGTAPAADATAAVEAAVETRIAAARDLLVSEATLADAIAEVDDALAFDVETTEDAAHQLAYFDGLGALDVLLGLPARVAAVAPGDVRRVARRYLQPGQRSIAWYLPGAEQVLPAEADVAEAAPAPPPAPPGLEPVAPPAVTRLTGGLPVIVQPSGLSSSVQLRVVFDGSVSGASAGDPVAGHSSLTWSVR